MTSRQNECHLQLDRIGAGRGGRRGAKAKGAVRGGRGGAKGVVTGLTGDAWKRERARLERDMIHRRENEFEARRFNAERLDKEAKKRRKTRVSLQKAIEGDSETKQTLQEKEEEDLLRSHQAEMKKHYREEKAKNAADDNRDSWETMSSRRQTSSAIFKAMDFEAVGVPSRRAMVASAAVRAKRRVSQLLALRDTNTVEALNRCKDEDPDTSDYGAVEDLAHQIADWALSNQGTAVALTLKCVGIQYPAEDVSTYPYKPFDTFPGEWCTKAVEPEGIGTCEFSS